MNREMKFEEIDTSKPLQVNYGHGLATVIGFTRAFDTEIVVLEYRGNRMAFEATGRSYQYASPW